jgi:hypothetical protein
VLLVDGDDAAGVLGVDFGIEGGPVPVEFRLAFV